MPESAADMPPRDTAERAYEGPT